MRVAQTVTPEVAFYYAQICTTRTPSIRGAWAKCGELAAVRVSNEQWPYRVRYYCKEHAPKRYQQIAEKRI